MSVEIYYFSGTGNSFHMARKLSELLPDAECIPMVKVIQSGHFITSAEKIGFVFPCHGLTIPIPVRNFVKSLHAVSSKYFFAVVTRGGSIFRGFPIIDTSLRKQGKYLNASFVIDMGLNDPKLNAFSVPTKEELDVLERGALQKLKVIREIVSENGNHYDDDNGVTFSRNGLLNYLLERLVPFMTHFISPLIKKYFYADHTCTGCGICEKVCPSRKIKMESKKPVWQREVDCYLCYACLNYCPSEAVQIYSKFWMKSYTTVKGRYPHPYATVKEIAKQKNGDNANNPH